MATLRGFWSGLLASVDGARAACPIRLFGGYRDFDCAQAILTGHARGAFAQDGVDEVDHLGYISISKTGKEVIL
jgi:hypothetical protein